jgi:hypothetical protein
MTPRERSLMALLGGAFVLTGFLFIGMTIRDGLNTLEEENAQRREALAALEVYRAKKAAGAANTPEIQIANEARDLPSYLEEIAKEVGVKIPEYSPQPQVPRGAYVEISNNIELSDVTLAEAANFMEKVETRDRTIIISEVRLERSSREEGQLRAVRMKITTFEKAKAGADGQGKRK